MGFLRPSAQALPPAPPPPVIEDTTAKQQEEADRLRMRKGRASSILSDKGGAAPVTASKVLLGQ